MLVIRFQRTGKKNQPFFKIVVTDKRRPATHGRFVEEVGFWNPLTKEKIVKAERVKYWLSVGAQPSPSVHNLLISEKVIEGKKIDVHKEPKAKEEKPAEAPAPVEEKPAEEKPAEEAKPAEEKKEEEKPTKEEKPIKESPKEEKPTEKKTPEETPKEELKKEVKPEKPEEKTGDTPKEKPKKE